MRFSVPSSFNLDTFFATCSLGGCDLQITTLTPTPEGWIVLQNGILEVTLNAGVNTELNRTLITSAVQTQGGSLEE